MKPVGSEESLQGMEENCLGSPVHLHIIYYLSVIIKGAIIACSVRSVSPSFVSFVPPPSTSSKGQEGVGSMGRGRESKVPSQKKYIYKKKIFL